MEKRLLVIQTAFLGDAILTLPMLQELKKKFPNSSIDVICIPSTADIFQHSPAVEEVLVYDKKKKQKSLLSLIKFVLELRKKKYERIYSPHRSFRTSLIVWLSGVKNTFGFENSSLSLVYKNRIKYDKTKHEVARNFELIGFETEDESWKVVPQIVSYNQDKIKVEKFVPKIKQNIIAIAPGSVWNTKIYPKEYYEIIATYLIEKDCFVIFIGGNEDKDLCEELERKFSNNAQSVAGKFNAVEMIELLNHCSLIISNDSAPTHMGVAADIPTITIYCSTIPEFGFYPYNVKSAYVSYNELGCKPCGIHGRKRCPIKTFDCGWNLEPQLVINMINQLLFNQEKQ